MHDQKDCSKPCCTEPVNDTGLLDKTGIGLSTACMLHCTALPLLVVLSPSLLGNLFDHASFHQWLLLLILPTAIIAFAIGWRRHRNVNTLVAGILGIALLLLAAFVGHDVLNELGEKLVTSAGGVLLAVGHLLNLRKLPR